MIAASSPTVPWDYDPWRDGTVTSAYAANSNADTIVFYRSSYREAEPEKLLWVESPWERRLRLSREGIVRRVKEGLGFVCRVRSVWQRVLYVSRTACQSERWRVLA